MFRWFRDLSERWSAPAPAPPTPPQRPQEQQRSPRASSAPSNAVLNLAAGAAVPEAVYYRGGQQQASPTNHVQTPAAPEGDYELALRLQQEEDRAAAAARAAAERARLHARTIREQPARPDVPPDHVRLLLERVAALPPPSGANGDREAIIHARLMELLRILHQAENARPRGLSAQAIAQLPERPYRFTGEREDCCICLDEFTDGAVVKALPCTHFFHNQCISEWMSKADSCPLCKRPAFGSGD